MPITDIHTSIYNAAISDSTVNACTSLALNQHASITIQSESIITIDNYSVKASDLSKKLQLLDRLIKEYLLEELV